ncbi:MAG TPA: OmpA family protein [Polyangia bacterium]|jgi:outer membrane protein OmpA-like peptidoglycan-associated protein
MRLTPVAKGFITIVALGVIALAVYRSGWIAKLAPSAPKQASSVPPKADLPEPGTPSLPAPGTTAPVALSGPPGCANLPEVRFYHWAWNAQAGLMLATGGKQAVAGSLMCQNGVNLRLIREDNSDTMQSLLLAFAEEMKRGAANPTKGAHFVAIMGDGSAVFLKGLNDKLKKLGPDYVAMVVGSAGYSRGEDKFMGPALWRDNPQAARGGLVAGVLRDGDWNIALKWLGDNKIPNNPEESSYDPDALNWVNASDYVEAAQKYVSGFCTDLKNVRTGKREKHCVNGVVTWTPGDVTVAEKKGGLVSIVSTKEYRSQMPNVIIGSKKWMAANRAVVGGMLQAIFTAGDQIKGGDDALQKAAAISAAVYAEKDAAYWARYFKVQVEKDRQGLTVELGGSSVNNLADNLELFGLLPGSHNLFAATYTVFGNIVKSQYPRLLPSFYPVAEIVDTSFVQELAKKTASAPVAAADTPTFQPNATVKALVSRRSWDIQFATGSAKFTPAAAAELKKLLSDLVIAGGTLVEIHGHTDSDGKPDANLKLSEERAFAVKQWLEAQSKTNFPEGRIRVHAHGQTQPVAPNATADGRAKNRRVEIVLGTAS